MKNKEKLYYSIGIAVIIAIIVFLCVVFFNRKYTITMYNDGEEYKVSKIEKGEKLKLPEAPEKEGYTFSGWYVDGKEFDSDTKITKDLELEAKWVKNTYTVIFKTGTGNDITKKVEYKDTVAKPSNPTKEGYEFAGWFIGEEKYDFATKVTKDLEITAKWTKVESKKSDVKKATTDNTPKAVSYKVEHYLMNTLGKYSNEPSYVDSFTTMSGMVVTPTVRSYKGFTSPSVQTVTVGNNTVVKYYYTRNKYKLELTKEDGEGITAVKGSGTYYYDEDVVIEATLHEGYSFAGWIENKKVKDSKAQTTIKMTDSNMSLEATSKINKYNVTFDLNGGKETIAAQEVTYNELIEKVENPTKEGYDFVGWTLDGAEFDFNTPMPAKDITLVANWKLADTTVIFYNEDGSQYQMYTNVKDKVTEPENNPTKKGYTFAGWYTKENQKFDFDTDTMPTSGGLELTAHFTANKYTVKFDANDGTGSITDQTFTYDEEQALTENNNSITREGYTFQGWSEEKNSNKVKYTDGEKVKNLTDKADEEVTLYAVWKANEITITYHSNTTKEETKTQTFTMKSTSLEENSFKNEIKIDYIYTAAIDDFIKENNTSETKELIFDSWCTENQNDCDSSNIINELKEMLKQGNGTLDLYAKWKATEINLDVNPELTKKAIIASYHKGYKFNGWYVDDEKLEDNKYNADKDTTIEARWIMIMDFDEYFKEFFGLEKDNYETTVSNKEITIDIKNPDVLIKDCQMLRMLVSSISQTNEEFKFTNKTKLSYLLDKTATMKFELGNIGLITVDEQDSVEYSFKFINSANNIIKVDEYKKFENEILPLINNHKNNRYEVVVNGSNITVKYAKEITDETVISKITDTAGINAALRYFFNIDEKKLNPLMNGGKLIIDVKGSLGEMKGVEITSKTFDDPYTFADNLFVAFKQATGLERTMHNSSLDEITLTVKIVPGEGKYLQDGIIDTYTITFGSQA